MLKISLIIPAYIISEHLVRVTKDCLESLEKDPPDELILIDNGSTVKSDLPFTHKIYPNAGYSGAVNLGFRKATGDVIVVGNNDLSFPEGWMKETREKFKKYDALAYRQSDQPNVSRFASIWAISKKAQKDIGMIDEQFFTAFADTDYWKRFINADYEIPRSDIIIGHTGSETFNEETSHDNNYSDGINKYRKKWGKID